MLIENKDTVKMKTVWVYECKHDLREGIHKVVVSGPNPSETEKAVNFLHLDQDESCIKQEVVIFINGVVHFLHT